jgi:hypothetical protein
MNICTEFLSSALSTNSHRRPNPDNNPLAPQILVKPSTNENGSLPGKKLACFQTLM